MCIRDRSSLLTKNNSQWWWEIWINLDRFFTYIQLWKFEQDVDLILGFLQNGFIRLWGFVSDKIGVYTISNEVRIGRGVKIRYGARNIGKLFLIVCASISDTNVWLELSPHSKINDENGLNQLGFNCVQLCSKHFRSYTHLLSEIWASSNLYMHADNDSTSSP